MKAESNFFPILKYLKLKIAENALCTLTTLKSSQWINIQGHGPTSYNC